MSKARSLRRAVGDLTRSGLTARNCGARMYRAGMDWVTLVAGSDFDPRRWLDADEAAAYNSLLPGTWWAQWWRGWNDEAATDVAGPPERTGDDGGRDR